VLLKDKLAALKRRIKSLQTLISKRLLNIIFLKLKALKTRVAKVNMLSKKINKTTVILNVLYAKIELV
jgi:hypothetical protein